jgi:hypothetical protein
LRAELRGQSGARLSGGLETFANRTGAAQLISGTEAARSDTPRARYRYRIGIPLIGIGAADADRFELVRVRQPLCL